MILITRIIYYIYDLKWCVSCEFCCCLEFQKIFPKAKDVISQAELVRDDLIIYNRKIAELNIELQMIPERCPLEVSPMCDMISGNKLQTENYTFLVRE